MTHLESFGAIKHYRELILRVENDKYLWHKVAHILNKLRRDLHPWQVVDRDNQRREAEKYAKQALKDTVIPSDVRDLMLQGMKSEFGFKFE